MTNNNFIVPLKYDFMFKALFGNEKNLKILTRFLSDFLEIDYNELNGKIKILNNELIKNDRNDKKKSVDVIVELNDNKIINLEMNANKDYPGLVDRNTAYICKIFSEQYLSGGDYKKTKKCIQININAFKYPKDKNGVSTFKLRDEEGIILTENLEIHNIDVEYINEICYTKNRKRNLDKWAKIFKTEKLSELKRSSEFMEEIGKELVYEVERLSSDEHIIGLYDAEKEEKMIRNSYILDAQEKGMKQGFEKGIEKGIEEGIEQRTKEIVMNMLQKNYSYEQIMDITKLNIDEIQNIEKDLK